MRASALLPLLVLLVACSGDSTPVDPQRAAPPVDLAGLADGGEAMHAGPPRGLLPGTYALVQGRHIGSVTSTAWSADGRLLATGAWDGTTRLWETGTGRLLHVLEGPTEDIEGIAFSPRGDRIAAVSRNSNGAIWEVASGRKLHDLTLHEDSV